MQAITIDAFHSFTLAILLLFAGKALTQRSELLRRYSIPEPDIGGFLCAGVTGLAWLLGDWQISFELGARDMLLLYFFAVGGVRGFAFTLGLTTLVDLLVVFLFTKPIVTILAGVKFFSSGHRLSGLSPKSIGMKQTQSVATLEA